MATDLLHLIARTLSSGLASGVPVPTDDEALYARVVDRVGVRISLRAVAQGRT